MFQACCMCEYMQVFMIKIHVHKLFLIYLCLKTTVIAECLCSALNRHILVISFD